jgi:Putative zinc-finger
MTAICDTPIPFVDLIAYHLDELDAGDAERIEAHYFGCAACSERLEVVSRLDAGVHAVVREGGLMVASTVALVDQARAQGIVIREYRTDPGEHVQCTAGPDDQLLVTRYGGLRGSTSADVHFRGAVVGTDQVIEMRMSDMPIDQRAGELVLIAPGRLNRSFPPLEIEVRLTVNTAAGPREEGPYHYHHRPWELLDEDERRRRAGR